MLTKEEQDFLVYWEQHREKARSFWSSLAFGGPMGLVFALPVLLAVLFHDWYKNMIPISNTQLLLISICVIGIAMFYAYFRQQVKWDRNEQFYKELKLRKQQEEQG